jgi:hypothetical protein
MDLSEEKNVIVTPIADPIASEKLTSKLLKLTTKCKYYNKVTYKWQKLN